MSFTSQLHFDSAISFLIWPNTCSYRTAPGSSSPQVLALQLRGQPSHAGIDRALISLGMSLEGLVLG